MGVQCCQPSKEPPQSTNKKRIQQNPNPNKNNPQNNDDLKSLSKASDIKKETEKKKENNYNKLKRSFFSSF